jgi:hypothetical protein
MDTNELLDRLDDWRSNDVETVKLIRDAAAKIRQLQSALDAEFGTLEDH